MITVYDLIKDFPESIKRSYEFETPKLRNNFKRIIVVGMGANYNAGLLLKQFLRDELPVEVFTRPTKMVDSKTLVVLMSYSGNTKEVINAFNKIEHKKNFLIITSGGKLLKIAKKARVKIIKLPEDLHHRFTFCECFFPLLKCLEMAGIAKSREEIIKDLPRLLRRKERKIEKIAHKLALKIKNKTPLFYATNYFWPVAYRFQASLEEDVKIICHANNLTELFHNELEALPKAKFYPFLFIDKRESGPFKKQIKFFKKRLKHYYEFPFYKYFRIERTFLAFYFAYFLAFYLSRIKHAVMGKTPISDKIKGL